MLKKQKLKQLEKYNSRDLYNLNKIDKNIKTVGKIIKGIVIITFIIIMLSSIISTSQMKNRRLIRSCMNIYLKEDFEEIPSNIDIWGNGFYIYKLENIPDLEIHAFFNKNKNVFIQDFNERIHKYFWEKWEDVNKESFVVKEEYEEYKLALTTKKSWILKYKTYIEVENYNEMLEAVETIIRFKKFMGEYSSIMASSYIKIGNEMILPNNVSPQTDDEIRESAKLQYIRIVKKNNLNYNDITKEIIDK